MSESKPSTPEPELDSMFPSGGNRLSPGWERAGLARENPLRVGRTALLAAAAAFRWQVMAFVLVVTAVPPFLPLAFLVMPAQGILKTLISRH